MNVRRGHGGDRWVRSGEVRRGRGRVRPRMDGLEGGREEPHRGKGERNPPG